MLLPQRINDKGLALLKSAEGLRLTAYKKPGDRWTIGYGHAGSDVRPGQVITMLEAESLLSDDLAWVEGCLNRVVVPELGSNQFSALACLVYNIGEERFETSTLLRMLNAGDFEGAAEQFLRWKYANGQPILLPRRQRERALFLLPDN